MPPAEPRIWMWSEALRMLERAERLHRQFFRPQASATPPAWEPPVDLVETADAWWIIIALPGVTPDQVEVTIGGGVITVAGVRAFPIEGEPADIHRLEIPFGRFVRRIEMPPGRLTVGRRELVDGCLVLTLNKTATEGPG